MDYVPKVHIPTVSVMVSTFRPGGLDLTLAGMRDQTFRDFELIIVDRRYEKRHQEVMDLAARYGIASQTFHVPEHRRNGKWTTICSAWNTAIAMSRGTYIIFLQDFACPPTTWIEEHLAVQTANRMVLCPYFYTDLPPLAPLRLPGFDFSTQHARGDQCTEEDAVLRGEVFDEMYIFAGPDGKAAPFDSAKVPELAVHEGWKQDVRLSIRPEPTSGVEHGWVHLKNDSTLRVNMMRINGLDERLERGKGPADIDVAFRLHEIGIELYWAANHGRYNAPNPRWYCKTMPYGALHTDNVDGRWSFDQGMRYNALRLAEIQASSDKTKTAMAKNPYDMMDLSRYVGAWREPEGKPRARDIDDFSYWGQNVQPDSK